MGKRDKKREEAALRQNLLTSTEAIKPSEAQLAYEAKLKKFHEQQAAGVDVKDLEALRPAYQIYQGATSDQIGDRQSNGILNLARGGNPAQTAALDTYLKYKRQQEAAGQLAGAYGATEANLEGTGFNYAQLANSMNLGKANASASAYDAYMKNKGQPMWKQIAGLAIGGFSALKPYGV